MAFALAMAAFALSACGGERPPADPQGAHVTRMAIHSAAIGRDEHVTVIVPPGRAPSG